MYGKNANLLECMFQLGIEVTFLVFFDQKKTVHVSATVTGQKSCWLSFPYKKYLPRAFIEQYRTQSIPAIYIRHLSRSGGHNTLTAPKMNMSYT
jgi:hypothetical protein